MPKFNAIHPITREIDISECEIAQFCRTHEGNTKITLIDGREYVVVQTPDMVKQILDGRRNQ